MDDLEKIQTDEARNNPPAPSKDALTATELIGLADCGDLECVQLRMKEQADDFVHARKGEFAALHRSVVMDTAKRELLMPLSTLYVETNPGANWRMAHTVHRPEMRDKLLNEFQQLGFSLADSGYFLGLRSRQLVYTSSKYPGRNLYLTTTYAPWYLKGLYKNVTWPCFVFEVYKE